MNGLTRGNLASTGDSGVAQFERGVAMLEGNVVQKGLA
jgi:hypothetical protein